MPGAHTLFLGSPSKGYFTGGGPQGSRVTFKKNDLGRPEVGMGMEVGATLVGTRIVCRLGEEIKL